MRVAPLESVEENKPLRVKIVGEQQDAFTLSRGTLGSAWRRSTTIFESAGSLP